MRAASDLGSAGFSASGEGCSRFNSWSKTAAGVSPAKGVLPGRHLEQHDSQCEKVGPRVERPSERLFRRHVADGAERRPGRRYLAWRRHVVLFPRRNGPEELGDAEVEDLDAIVVGNHDVRRLQISVQDSRGVSARKPVRDLSSEGQHPRERKRNAVRSRTRAGFAPGPAPS